MTKTSEMLLTQVNEAIDNCEPSVNEYAEVIAETLKEKYGKHNYEIFFNTMINILDNEQQ